jgi:hypothetical protein
MFEPRGLGSNPAPPRRPATKRLARPNVLRNASRNGTTGVVAERETIESEVNVTLTPFERRENGHAPVLTLAPPPETVTRRTLTVRRVYLWPIARLAIVVWCAAGLAILLTVIAVLTTLRMSGTINRFEEFVTDLTGLEEFHVMSDAVLGTIAILVLLFVVTAIAFTVLAAAFYNAHAALVGGIDLTCDERTTTPVPREPERNGH